MATGRFLGGECVNWLTFLCFFVSGHSGPATVQLGGSSERAVWHFFAAAATRSVQCRLRGRRMTRRDLQGGGGGVIDDAELEISVKSSVRAAVS
jgi:hypothetical protein